MKISNTKNKGFKNYKVKILLPDNTTVDKFIVIEETEDNEISKYVAYMLKHKQEAAVFNLLNDNYLFIKIVGHTEGEITSDEEGVSGDDLIVLYEKRTINQSNLMIEIDSYFYSTTPAIIDTSAVVIPSLVDVEKIYKIAIITVSGIIVLVLSLTSIWGYYQKKKKEAAEKAQAKIKMQPLSEAEDEAMRYYLFRKVLEHIIETSQKTMHKEGERINTVNLSIEYNQSTQIMVANISYNKIYSYPSVLSKKSGDLFSKSESASIALEKNIAVSNGLVEKYESLKKCDIVYLYNNKFDIVERGERTASYNYSSDGAMAGIERFKVLSGIVGPGCKFKVNTFAIADNKLSATIVVYY